MSIARLRFVLLAGLMAATVATSAAIEISTETLTGLNPRTLPKSVAGLELRGSATAPIKLALTGADGRLRPEATPAVALLRDAAWSPDDPARDAAGEFEVMVGAARLVRNHALAGFVTVGNHFGALQPGTEAALQRTVLMGLPVVRSARDGDVRAAPGDLLISAGSLSAAEARRILSYCLINYGSLPPAADPARPTQAETDSIRARLRLYQQAFDLANVPLLAAYSSEAAAMAAMP
ncbi:MAG TPA: hypothetical protein VGD88_06720 [Opitutaceae bacterium]